MKIVDLSGVKQNKYVYGGLSGRKLGITYNGENYLLKFPGSLKNRNLRNINLSYSNSPVCEYIGSKIYRSIGIEVHDTFLGMISNKIIVACKDFCMPGEELQEFGKIKITYAQDFLRTGGELTDGTSTDLAEIEDVIKHHPVFENIKGIQEHFWNMFVVDALIGNADRNNGNWGIIVDAVSKEFKRIAPVYDNGGCLFNKWDDAKIREVLDTPSAVIERAYKGVVSIFESKGRRVNPFTFMQQKEAQSCNAAVLRIVPRINLESISRIIDDVRSVDAISDLQSAFFKKILDRRYNEVLLPLYLDIKHERFREEHKNEQGQGF